MKINTINTSYKTQNHNRQQPKSNSFNKNTSSSEPFSLHRQYIRTLNFTKLERLFSKPFIKSYDTFFTNGITRISKHLSKNLFVCVTPSNINLIDIDSLCDDTNLNLNSQLNFDFDLRDKNSNLNFNLTNSKNIRNFDLDIKEWRSSCFVNDNILVTGIERNKNVDDGFIYMYDNFGMGGVKEKYKMGSSSVINHLCPVLFENDLHEFKNKEYKNTIYEINESHENSENLSLNLNEKNSKLSINKNRDKYIGLSRNLDSNTYLPTPTNGSLTKSFIASSTSSLSIFDLQTITPKYQIKGSFTYSSFNSELNIIGSCSDHFNSNSNQNELVLIDDRIGTEFSKIKFNSQVNSCSFSHKNCYNLVCGCEDGNAYLIDLRMISNKRYSNSDTNDSELDFDLNSSSCKKVYKGHTRAILDIKFRPNTNNQNLNTNSKDEFVTGSYDKTLRTYTINKTKGRDIYYNKRMEQITCLEYDTDGSRVVCGSTDGAVRVWRSDASLSSNDDLQENSKNKMYYKQKHIQEGRSLKEFFGDVGEIRRIDSHRFIPKNIKNEMRDKIEMEKAEKRRREKREREIAEKKERNSHDE